MPGASETLRAGGEEGKGSLAWWAGDPAVSKVPGEEKARGLQGAEVSYPLTPAAHAPRHFRREPAGTSVDLDLAMPTAFPNLKTGPLGTEMPSHQASLKEGSQEHEPGRDVRQRPLKATVCMFRSLSFKRVTSLKLELDVPSKG